MASGPSAPPPRVVVIASVQRRRRRSTAEEVRLVGEAARPGVSASHVARRHGVAPSLPLGRKRRMLEGGLQAVAAGEDVVGASPCAGWKGGCASSSACSAERRSRTRSPRRPSSSRGRKKRPRG